LTCWREFDWLATDNANALNCAYAYWSRGGAGNWATSVQLGSIETTNATTYPAEETDKALISDWTGFADLTDDGAVDFKQPSPSSISADARYEKVSEDYDAITQGGWADKVMKVTVRMDKEDIRDDEAAEVAWAKSLKEGGLTLKGKQYLKVSTKVASKEFSYVMFQPAAAGGDGAGAGGDGEADSAKTLFMAVGALGAAFAALTF